MDILQTNPADWKYVSEGGATIVLSYKGPPHPGFDGTVLRLRKTPVGTTTLPGEDDSDDPTVEFGAKCMPRLIPLEYLPRLQTVELSRPWLEALVQVHDQVRPISRREKDQVNFNRRKGVLATDLIGGDWLAVEIKPKWGFLPSPIHLSEETQAIKTQTCRFCLHSHFRAQKGEQSVTDYCPLDLFSGDVDRIRRAIGFLWDAWVASNATANNLKIFASGKYVVPSEAEKLFAEGQSRIQDTNMIRNIFAEALLQPLLRTSVLRILSDLQRNLDILDIEGLSKLWKEAESASLEQNDGSSFTPLGQFSDPVVSEWLEFLDIYTSSQREKLNHREPSPKDMRYYLLAYLLSATFKDCSIVVRLDYLQVDKTTEQGVTPNSIAVIDLDPKSTSKLKGWLELDKQIVAAYSPVQRKVCIDANQII